MSRKIAYGYLIGLILVCASCQFFSPSLSLSVKTPKEAFKNARLPVDLVLTNISNREVTFFHPPDISSGTWDHRTWELGLIIKKPSGQTIALRCDVGGTGIDLAYLPKKSNYLTLQPQEAITIDTLRLHWRGTSGSAKNRMYTQFQSLLDEPGQYTLTFMYKNSASQYGHYVDGRIRYEDIPGVWTGTLKARARIQVGK
jgi:hypothetical protein